ncbi:MAG: hypothetical protein EOO96_27175 [Pedobacter sp.]|nr:MAG: hypothetical protein EOO96_27175 [Pedobacter sp.]
MGFIYVLLAAAVLFVFFAILTSILTIWFRNKAMRIISLVFTVFAFIVYIILVVNLDGADEIFGISADKLFFFPVAIPLYLQSYFAMQSATKTFARKLFFSLASLIIVRLLSVIIGTAADVLYKNSLDEIALALWKVNSYVFFPLLFAGISYVFAKIFHPDLKVFKELVIKTLIVLAVISVADELLTMLVMYTKFKEFIVYDLYTYPLIVVISLFQIVVGSLLGLYLYKNKHDNISV